MQNKFYPHPVLAFAVLLLCYGIINFLLLPHNPLAGYPIYGDDYDALARQFQDVSWKMPRPVFFTLAPFFNLFSLSGHYFFVLSLMILSAMLTFYFAENFFMQKLSFIWLLFYAFLVFSFPFVIDVSKDLGLAINHLSCIFSLCTLIFLLKGYRKNKSLYFFIAACFYFLGIFIKEDFILPPFLLMFYLFIFEKTPTFSEHRKIKLVSFFIFTLSAVSLLFYFDKYIAQSPFTGVHASSVSPYQVNLSLGSLLKVYGQYLSSNAYMLTLSLGIVLTFILSLFFADKPFKIKLFVWITILIALILPYSILPQHVFYTYIYNWTPWEGAVIVFTLYFLTQGWPKKILYPIIGLLMLDAIISSYPHRSYTSVQYEKNAHLSKTVEDTLRAYKNTLNHMPIIGVVGVKNNSPWGPNDATYISRVLGLTSHWIIFLHPSEVFLRLEVSDRYDPKKAINVLDIKKIGDFSKIPFLYLDEKGKGTLKKPPCE